MLSKTCKYAIRATIFIAQKSKEGNKVGIKEIAKGIDSPEHFIAKILQDLSRKGYIQSTKGPNGGFYMTEKNLQLSIADIVREIDGHSLFLSCALGLRECSDAKPCPIHNEFKHIRKSITELLEKYKFSMFVEDSNLILNSILNI